MDNFIAATAIAATNIQVALMQRLVIKGLITPREVKETLESALIMIEAHQAMSPHLNEALTLAHRMIEENLPILSDEKRPNVPEQIHPPLAPRWLFKTTQRGVTVDTRGRCDNRFYVSHMMLH